MPTWAGIEVQKINDKPVISQHELPGGEYLLVTDDDGKQVRLYWINTMGGTNDLGAVAGDFR